MSKHICCDCGALVCKQCGACSTEHNEDPVDNCPKKPIHTTSVSCKVVKQLEAENKSLKEILHFGHLDRPLVAVIGKAMEEKRKTE